MAYEIVKVRQNTYETYADGQERVARGNRRGELIVLDTFSQAVFDKRVFQASIGSATTPVSFAKTAYDADQPQLAIDVPAGVTYALGTLQNMWIAPDNGVAPTSRCSVYSLYTGNGTDTTAAVDFREIDRWVYAFADTTLGPVKEYHWSALQKPTVVINGNGSLVIWIDGTTTAPAGFVRVKWMELSDSEV